MPRNKILNNPNPCGHKNCTDRIGTQGAQGFCNKHYRKRLRMGLYDSLVDAQPTREYMNVLISSRWTLREMHRVTGLSASTLSRIYTGDQRRVLKSSERYVLALRPKVTVTQVGFKRRYQALGWMGWDSESLAREMGSTSKNIRRTAYGQRSFSVEYGERFREVYDRLSNTPGPSKMARRLALSKNWPPPISWDDDTIDTAPDLKAGIVRTDRRLRGKYRTHCKRNHEQTEENVLWNPGNVRKCRLCHNLNVREYRKRQRELKTA